LYATHPTEKLKEAQLKATQNVLEVVNGGLIEGKMF